MKRFILEHFLKRIWLPKRMLAMHLLPNRVVVYIIISGQLTIDNSKHSGPS
uniref:Uncharacterized protein n=1 Tax=Arundo donax TaxID=35708 RepID=A0A0A9GBE6_ARUDO